ncbi:MAG TPA: ABC transporter permease subunit [Rhodospirillaceae bacterium]|nr:ABC transporter permease subunit [Rhodospirillaceae bacterium]
MNVTDSFALPAIRRPAMPNHWDVLAFVLVISAVTMVAHAHHGMVLPFEVGKTQLDISLDPVNLPEYALQTTLRMAIAMVCSIVFSLAYAALAAKSRLMEKLLIPVLDILQSVPILSFLTITVTGFIALFPGSLMGVECASIFAIFTSQAWNITFSLYQSFKTVPLDLEEASRMFRASAWRKFWCLEVPYAMPQMVWNLMMSASGGWFFVVASEAITVADSQVTLPGIGSYIAAAIDAKDIAAVGYALAAMLFVIVAVDQLVMRPLLVWSDKFRPSDDPGEKPRESWFLDMVRGAMLVNWIADSVSLVSEFAGKHLFSPAREVTIRRTVRQPMSPALVRAVNTAWNLALISLAAYSLWEVKALVTEEVDLAEIRTVFFFGFLTAARVLFWIVIASLVWVPIGVMVGLRPRLAQTLQPVVQIMAAFPANLLFPIAVILITRFGVDPEYWLSPLMILGTQWYILFNVIGGMSTMPAELQFAAQNFGAKGFMWWRKVALPYVLPAYVTGVVTASGGSWNASIVAEIVKWGDTTLSATGIGAYIAKASAAGDMSRVVLGSAVLCVFVTLINRLLWRRLYAWAEERVRLN